MELKLEMMERRFSYNGLLIIDYILFILKGNIQEKGINIVTSIRYDKNYININLVNQLLILELNIDERKYIFWQKRL